MFAYHFWTFLSAPKKYGIPTVKAIELAVPADKGLHDFTGIPLYFDKFRSTECRVFDRRDQRALNIVAPTGGKRQAQQHGW